MKTVPQLLLVEDDPTIAELLAYNLRDAGYEVLRESDGQSGLGAALSYDIDLAIVDVMLPVLDGLSVAEELSRRKPDVPIIILTALTEHGAMLRGYAAGIDDFVVKPFDLDDLLARIAARLRRSGAPLTLPEHVAIGGLTLDRDAHIAHSPTGEVFLKPKEHELLALLLSTPGRLFRREEITQAVWHQSYVPGTRTLDVHVRHLRVKLEDISAPARIENVRGVGYRLVPSTEVSPS